MGKFSFHEYLMLTSKPFCFFLYKYIHWFPRFQNSWFAVHGFRSHAIRWSLHDNNFSYSHGNRFRINSTSSADVGRWYQQVNKVVFIPTQWDYVHFNNIYLSIVCQSCLNINFWTYLWTFLNTIREQLQKFPTICKASLCEIDNNCL